MIPMGLAFLADNVRLLYLIAVSYTPLAVYKSPGFSRETAISIRRSEGDTYDKRRCFGGIRT